MRKEKSSWIVFLFQISVTVLYFGCYVNAKSVHKIEAIPKRVLCFMLNDYESSYEDLLKISGKASVNLRITWTWHIELLLI